MSALPLQFVLQSRYSSLSKLLAGIALLSALSGCSSAYYGAMEKFGVQKREILVSRVGKAKEAQQDTKEQFASALDAYMAVVNVPGSDLETKYRTLLDAYESSKEQSNELDNRIDAVEDVANALFKEWGERNKTIQQ
jgi:hypothetical protein